MILPHGWSTARVHDYGGGMYLRHSCGWMSNRSISENDSHTATGIMNGHICSGYLTEVVEVVDCVDPVGYVDVVDVVEVVEDVVEYVVDDGGYDNGYDSGYSSDW